VYLGQDEEPEPGTPEFGARAAQRRASIYSTPIPPTSGPPLLFLPAQAVGRAAAAGAQAAGQGLFSGLGNVLVIGGLLFGAWYLFGRRR
jgi:hypothetical protein